jgi:hypothetical protein
MDAQILHTLQHSLGVDEYGRGDQYRNHFVTGEGSVDYPICMAAVERRLMNRRAGNALSGGDWIFHVTDAGKAWMAERSPEPPKLTRSQKRYQRYLDADTSESFIEFLRRIGRQEKDRRGELAW